MMDQWFTWSGDWDQRDTWQYVFHNVTLVRNIGSFRSGTRILEALVDFRQGTLSLTTNHVHTETFDIRSTLEQV